MTIPRKPYLLRALVAWTEDNGWTPLLAVDATGPGVQVPASHVEDGRITLNISAGALHQREMDNEAVRGYARFGGRSEFLELPMAAISALIVRETGEGMVLPDDEAASVTSPVGDDPGPSDDDPPSGGGRSHLRVVK